MAQSCPLDDCTVQLCLFSKVTKLDSLWIGTVCVRGSAVFPADSALGCKSPPWALPRGIKRIYPSALCPFEGSLNHAFVCRCLGLLSSCLILAISMASMLYQQSASGRTHSR